MLFVFLISVFTISTGFILIDIEISQHGGYVFEYHSSTNLLTVKDVYTCYFVPAKGYVEDMFMNKTKRNMIQNKLLELIKYRKHIRPTTLVQSSIDYQDGFATTSCVGRKLFKLAYPPQDQTTYRPTSASPTTQEQTPAVLATQNATRNATGGVHPV